MRRPSLKLMETTMSTTELPTTMPVIVESSAQRITWTREKNDALDERGLIDEQIESAKRVHTTAHGEAVRIRDARIEAANKAMDRELADAERMRDGTIVSLQKRQADIDKMIAGYDAALGASA